MFFQRKVSEFVLGLMFLEAVVAKSEVPDHIAGVYGETRRPEPKPCCAPKYYTFRAVHFLTYSLSGGVLQEEIQRAQIAYDSIAQKTANKIHLGFTNGTEDAYFTIDDYSEGVSYSIYRSSGTEVCHVGKLEGPFHYDCISNDATYVGSSTIGDRAVELDTWYTKHEGPGVDTHRESSVEMDSCVLVFDTFREVDPKTGDLLATGNAHITDFALGICGDPFKVPESCFKKTQDIFEMPPRMRKIRKLGPVLKYIGQ